MRCKCHLPLGRTDGIRERALGPVHPGVAMCLENTAILYRETVRANAAEGLEKRAAVILAIKR